MSSYTMEGGEGSPYTLLIRFLSIFFVLSLPTSLAVHVCYKTYMGPDYFFQPGVAGRLVDPEQRNMQQKKQKSKKRHFAVKKIMGRAGN